MQIAIFKYFLSSKSESKLKKAHNLTCKTPHEQVLYNRPL